MEGRRRVLGEKHKKTLDLLNNMGAILGNIKDYQGALGYYQQVIRVQEKVVGKTHPSTLDTIMNMASTYMEGLKDFVKAEKMYRQALDGFERSLGREHDKTKLCAVNLAVLLGQKGEKEKMREHVKVHPHLLQERSGFGDLVKNFIR